MKKQSELEKTIAALPPNPRGSRKWSLEEDALLLKFGEEKGILAIAKILGVADSTLRRRFAFLQASLRVK